MSSFTFEGAGRIIAMHIDRGELLLETIQKELDKLGVKNAVVLSCIGTLRKASYHYISNTNEYPVDKFETVEGAIELGCAQGMVLDGQPHIHIVFADLERAYSGHLEPGCEVQNLIELLFMEVPSMALERKKNEFGIAYLALKEG